MMFWFLFFVVLIWITFVIFSEKNNPIYTQIIKNYTCKFKIVTKNRDKQFLYFWLNESPRKKDYLNGMFVYTDESGVYIEPTVAYFYFKPVFIPWDKLEKTGELTRWFEKKTSYSINELGITIAFTKVARITT